MFTVIQRLLYLCALSLLVITRTHANNPAPIVVTIKPLYSLVAHLTEGIETPVLLMKQAQSPHHYNMRPSERWLLANARIIVWVGPQMESHISKILKQQKSTTTVISVMQAKNLKLLNKRKKHSADENEHIAATSQAESHMIDPHIWLSTYNAAAISKQISERLITLDSKNAEQYKKNLQQLLSKIEQTRDTIKTTLKNPHQPFIAFHDAFQYFENENKLNYIDSINFDDETGTSLKHLRQIRTRIDKNNIQCLVYQAPKPAIIDTLTRQSTIKAIALDPLGLDVKNDKNAWFELMQQLAANFNDCLSS
jgi:zinc transport system substrate-binding protein